MATRRDMAERQGVLPSQEPKLQSAERLLRGAEYSHCIDACSSLPVSTARNLLLARAYYRSHQIAKARDTIVEIMDQTMSQSERVDATLILALAASADGKYADAEHELATLDPQILRELSPNQRDHVEYVRALCAWTAGRKAEAERIVNAVSTSDNPEWHAKFLVMRSWIAASNDHFIDQAHFLAKALQQLRRIDSPDIGVMANALQGLALISREVFVPEAAELAIEIASTLPWTEDLCVERFHTSRALAWVMILRGDAIAGIRAINTSRALAPSPYWEVFARLDHAMLARLAGDTIGPEADLLDADEFLTSLDWTKTEGEEVVALLLAAELFATVNPARARALLEEFVIVRERLPNGSGFRHNQRLLAMEHFTRALIEEKSGKPQRAMQQARYAFDIFETMDFNWRAARAALILHECSGAEQWLAKATEKIAPYPRSFVAHAIAKKRGVIDNAALERFTPKEREVFILLCSGISTEEAAFKLRSSPNTVRNHIRKIHRKFQTKSRAQLLTKAARLGLLPDAR